MNRPSEPSSAASASGIIRGLWGVRYQVEDVSRSVDFYTQQLGFSLDYKRPPAFAQVSADHLKLILSGPGASGCPDASHHLIAVRRVADGDRFRDGIGADRLGMLEAGLDRVHHRRTSRRLRRVHADNSNRVRPLRLSCCPLMQSIIAIPRLQQRYDHICFDNIRKTVPTRRISSLVRPIRVTISGDPQKW